MAGRTGSAYQSPGARAFALALRFYGALVLGFLVLPLLVVVPLSFNAGSFLTYPLSGLSVRWYEDLLSSRAWSLAFRNSLMVGLLTTAIATVLGTSAALGLKRLPAAHARWISVVVLSPIVVPVVISAVGLYFLYAPLGLTSSFSGLVLAHTVLATPFVVITVGATLEGFDPTLIRAAQSCGASPLVAFRRVVLPLIMPGVVSGAVFAFATSFDDIVMALFLAGPEQRTLPVQMFNGVREEISPTITAAATLLVCLAVALLGIVEWLRRRSARLGIGVAGGTRSDAAPP
jgi:putative spermidine/putrescine transport system permease protein